MISEFEVGTDRMTTHLEQVWQEERNRKAAGTGLARLKHPQQFDEVNERRARHSQRLEAGLAHGVQRDGLHRRGAFDLCNTEMDRDESVRAGVADVLGMAVKPARRHIQGELGHRQDRVGQLFVTHQG